jgi:cold shock protein
MEKSIGTIIYYYPALGYGYVRINNTGQEIFIHESGLIDAIKAGDQVTFDIDEEVKGLQAINIKKKY